MYALVNEKRSQQGLRSLVRVDGLALIARAHSQRMIDEGKLYHNPNLKSELAALKLGVRWSGENVGVGPDVDTVQDSFLASQAHLANIARPNYTSLGIGVVWKSTGYAYVTQVFAQVNPPAAPMPPRAPVRPAAPSVEPPDPAPTAAVVSLVSSVTSREPSAEKRESGSIVYGAVFALGVIAVAIALIAGAPTRVLRLLVRDERPGRRHRAGPAPRKAATAAS